VERKRSDKYGKKRKKGKGRTDFSAQPDDFRVVTDDLLRLVELLHGDRRLSALRLQLEAVDNGLSTALRVSAGEDVEVASEGVDEVSLSTTSGADVGLVRSEVGGVKRETKVGKDLSLGSCRNKGKVSSRRLPSKRTQGRGRTLKESNRAGFDRTNTTTKKLRPENARRQRDFHRAQGVVGVGEEAGHGVGAGGVV
jgi:hypothetical protein